MRDFTLYSRILGLILVFFSAAKRLFYVGGWRKSDNQEKHKFLQRFGDFYGYGNGAAYIDRLRASEFQRLEEIVYLDHAGTTLYSNSQIHEALTDYSLHLYGNPHSQSDSSIKTSEMIESARQQVLEYFHASPKDYVCIFTSGATAALKLVGEAFPWTLSSHFFYTLENHNSVLGIREYALSKGATTIAVEISRQKETMKRSTGQRRQVMCQESNGESYNLFAMPTECNFSGAKFSLELVKRIKEGRLMDERGQWLVLLDAAKSSGTCPPDLTQYPADFLVTSFYKIFGYPTGLGALIVRREVAKLLKTSYFGGGTVAVSIADFDYVKRRENIEQRLEDGTVSFLSIGALRFGFSAINRIGITSIARHTWSLTHYTASALRDMKHANGAPLCCLYGNHGVFQSFMEEFPVQGPVITFNLKRGDGSWIGHREVEKLASLCQIHLRSGCFCNPGACSKYLGLSNKDMQLNFEAGHVCWDDRDIISGKPTGAVRISFGYMSTLEDSQSFLHFIRKYFLDQQNTVNISQQEGFEHSTRMYLKSITVYPIKSCAGFNVDSWPVVSSGLLYDREWLVCDINNVALTQKKVPSMCLISTFIDLENAKLIVRSPNVDQKLEIPLEERCEVSGEVFLCGERATSKGYGSYVTKWFTKALGVDCRLLRKGVETTRVCKWRTPEHSIPSDSEDREVFSFANEGQFLLLSEASLQDLNTRTSTDGRVDAMQFRPNLVVSGSAPYKEDTWHMLSIGDIQLPVIGGCNRCKMITVNQRTGARHLAAEPLLTLASYRRRKGKILFGVLLGPPSLPRKVEKHVLTVESPVISD